MHPSIADNTTHTIMTPICRTNCEESNDYFTNDSDESWSRGVWTVTGLASVLLLVGVLSNAYTLWVTATRRYAVRWETSRLTMRYSSVIDMSMCIILVSVVLWPWLLFQTGHDIDVTLRCTRVDLGKGFLGGLFLIASGTVVVCRQVNMLHTFDEEDALLQQHGWRAVKLMRDVVIVGVVCMFASSLLGRLIPHTDMELCLALGSPMPRAINLILVQVGVNIALGIIVVVTTKRPDVEAEKRENDEILPEKTMPVKPSDEFENASGVVPHSRWSRFVIVSSASVLTWILLAISLALTGLLMQPVDVGTFFVLVVYTAQVNAWSVFAIVRYWV